MREKVTASDVFKGKKVIYPERCVLIYYDIYQKYLGTIMGFHTLLEKETLSNCFCLVYK